VLTTIVVSLFVDFDTFFSLLCGRDVTGVDAHCGEPGGSIWEQVGEKRNTVCTHGYADCLLKKTTSNKYNKYGVNQKHEHVDDISFRELFGMHTVVNQVDQFDHQTVLSNRTVDR
jgi:hypothetical protein